MSKTWSGFFSSPLVLRLKFRKNIALSDSQLSSPWNSQSRVTWKPMPFWSAAVVFSSMVFTSPEPVPPETLIVIVWLLPILKVRPASPRRMIVKNRAGSFSSSFFGPSFPGPSCPDPSFPGPSCPGPSFFGPSFSASSFCSPVPSAPWAPGPASPPGAPAPSFLTGTSPAKTTSCRSAEALNFGFPSSSSAAGLGFGFAGAFPPAFPPGFSPSLSFSSLSVFMFRTVRMAKVLSRSPLKSICLKKPASSFMKSLSGREGRRSAR